MGVFFKTKQSLTYLETALTVESNAIYGLLKPK